MEQEKIGRFIALCRREKGLTQAQLAQYLGITDRAVSKWETGKSLPDAATMPELCDLLGIDLNELFSGERLDGERYAQMAAAHLLELRKQEELANRKLLDLEVVLGLISTGAFLLAGLAMGFAVSAPGWRVALSLGGMVLFGFGMVYCLRIERETGYYVCPECGTTYIPSMRAIVAAPHLGRSRKMTCPHCGKRSYHKKVLTK